MTDGVGVARFAIFQLDSCHSSAQRTRIGRIRNPESWVIPLGTIVARLGPSDWPSYPTTNTADSDYHPVLRNGPNGFRGRNVTITDARVPYGLNFPAEATRRSRARAQQVGAVVPLDFVGHSSLLFGTANTFVVAGRCYE